MADHPDTQRRLGLLVFVLIIVLSLLVMGAIAYRGAFPWGS